MKSFNQTTASTVMLLASLCSAAAVSSLNAELDLKPRGADLLYHLEQRAPLNWTDDGTGQGGMLAFVPDDLWGQAHEDFASMMKMKRDSGDLDLVMVKRQASDGTEDVDMNGKTREVSWWCRSGLGQSIAKATPTAVVCAGLRTIFQAAHTGQWLWTAPRPEDPNLAQPPGAPGPGQMIATVTLNVVNIGIDVACVNTVLHVVGENTCGGSAKRSVLSLDATSGELVSRQNLDGGGIITIDDAPGSNIVIATIDIGVRWDT